MTKDEAVSTMREAVILLFEKQELQVPEGFRRITVAGPEDNRACSLGAWRQIDNIWHMVLGTASVEHGVIMYWDGVAI